MEGGCGSFGFARDEPSYRDVDIGKKTGYATTVIFRDPESS